VRTSFGHLGPLVCLGLVVCQPSFFDLPARPQHPTAGRPEAPEGPFRRGLSRPAKIRDKSSHSERSAVESRNLSQDWRKRLVIPRTLNQRDSPQEHSITAFSALRLPPPFGCRSLKMTLINVFMPVYISSSKRYFAVAQDDMPGIGF
jgi:hypothetical protein